MSEIKLLPCPFCGGEAKLYSGIGYAVVGCKKEDCQGSACCYKYNSKKEAIEQWNTRKPMERIIEKLAERMTVQEVIELHLKPLKERAFAHTTETALTMAIQALEEVEQYRALGTVEELTNQKHNLSVAYKCIEELQQPKTDWIPCEERLPSGEEYRKQIDGIWYYQHMLTATNDSDIPMQVGWYNQEDECWYDQDGFVFYPIAWQPLPAPYKKDHLGEATGMVKEGDSDAC